MPKNSNEIVISDSLLKNNSKIDLKIGDEINLSIGKRVDLDGNALDNTSSYHLSYICKDHNSDVSCLSFTMSCIGVSINESRKSIK